MEYTVLGRTGLKVGVAGLGCGGNSRLGLGRGRSADEAVALVHRALDLGVNLIDTAAAYGTEETVGRAVRGRDRDAVVVSTKALPYRDETPIAAAEIVASLDASLRRLGLAHVDVFHIHAVLPQHYARMRDEYVPVLEAERAKGKFRFLGITESPPFDPAQAMLGQAVRDDCWDVMMVGFHMLHQKPRERVLRATAAKGIGTLMMFAVRNVFSVPGRLQAEIRRQAEAGALPAALADHPDPLGFLVRPGGAASVIDAAYRYVRHEPGCDVVLFGTGDAAHLEANVASILRPPYPSRTARGSPAISGRSKASGSTCRTGAGAAAGSKAARSGFAAARVPRHVARRGVAMGPKKTKAPPRKDARFRDTIKAVARDLYVRRGYEGFSFGDIVAVTGTTRANVHHHFGNKLKLMDELVADIAADAEARIASHWCEGRAPFSERLDRQVDDLRKFYTRYNTRAGERSVWSPLSRLRLDIPVLGRLAVRALERIDRVYDAALTAAVEEAIAAGEFRKDTPVADVARLVRFTVQSCAPMTQDTGGFGALESLFRSLDRTIAAAWGRRRKG